MQSQSIYKKLIQIIPDIATREEAGKSKLSSDALMDLNLDVLSKQENIVRIALSHYYKQNGDMIADPDMEIIINTQLMTANAMTYQDSMIFQSSEQDGGINQKLVISLNEFLDQWLQNCIDQGHKIE
jgi:uncharacterized protein YqiB (DUF1249 family)